MRPASGGVELRNRHLRMFFFCAGLFFVSSALLLPLAAQQTFKKAVPTAADWADIGGRGIAQSSSQNVFFLCGTFFRVLRVAFASRRPADLQKGGPYRRGLGRYRGEWNCAIVISECFFSVRDFFSCPPRCFCLSPPSRPSKRRSLPPRIGPPLPSSRTSPAFGRFLWADPPPASQILPSAFRLASSRRSPLRLSTRPKEKI